MERYLIIWILVMVAIEFVCIIWDIRDYRKNKNKNKKEGIKRNNRDKRKRFNGEK